MKKCVLIALCGLLAACGSTGVKPEQFSVEILDYGVLTFEEADKGQVKVTSVATTDEVPFERGTAYGIIYKVTGEPADARIQLKLQPVVTPASTQQGKRKLGRIYQPIYRIHGMGDIRSYTTSVGFFRQPRRPYETLLLVLDMNGKVLAKTNFTVREKDDMTKEVGEAKPITNVLVEAKPNLDRR